MSERTTASEQRGVTHYKVVAPADATPAAVAAPAAIGKAAVFVVHGMGQQIQFQTLDDVAEGLRAANVRRGGGPTPRPGVRAVAVGDERPQRIELTLTDGDRRTREVHIYEAYWSPITEGEVTLRDVMRFLFNAGVDGWRHSFDPFRRYVAGSLHEFPTPVRTPVYLATALLVASALVVVNLAIAFIISFHHPARPDSGVATPSVLPKIISGRWIVCLRSATEGVLWTLTAIGAVSLGGPWFLKVARNAREDLFGPDPGEKDTW